MGGHQGTGRCGLSVWPAGYERAAAGVAPGTLPELLALVSRRGQTHVEVIGTMAAQGAEPLRRDTLFRIASLTKPITAVAALILVEEGVLRLDALSHQGNKDVGGLLWH